MSCFIQKEENVAAIADYIARVLNCSYELVGFHTPMELHEALNDLGCMKSGYFEEERIYKELCKLNRKAYNSRYPNHMIDVLDFPKYRSNSIAKPCKYIPTKTDSRTGRNIMGHFQIEAWHYQIYKMLQCFLYQCYEGEYYKTDLYKGLKDFERKIADFIISNNDDYVKAEWE